MKVTDLTKEQLIELKQAYLTEVLLENGKEPSMEQLIYVDDYVDNLEVYARYWNTTFTNDDFFCTAGKVDE